MDIKKWVKSDWFLKTEEERASDIASATIRSCIAVAVGLVACVIIGLFSDNSTLQTFFGGGVAGITGGLLRTDKENPKKKKRKTDLQREDER